MGVLHGWRIEVQGHDVTDHVEAPVWEQTAEEISDRLSFVCDLHPTDGTTVDGVALYQLCAPGAPVRLLDANGEMFRGQVFVWEHDESADARHVTVTAYDYNGSLARSKIDVRFYRTASASEAIERLRDPVQGQGLNIYHELPDVQLLRAYWRGVPVAEMLIDVVVQVRMLRGAKDFATDPGVYFIRARGDQTQIVRPGGNANVYWFTAANADRVTSRVDVLDLITRARVVGVEQDVVGLDGTSVPTPFVDQRDSQGTLPDGTRVIDRFGVIQEIVYQSQFSGSRDWARSAMDQLLAQRGEPHRVHRVTAAETPVPVRKGEAHEFHVGTLDGKFVVTATSHDLRAGTQTIEVDVSGFLGRNLPLVTPRLPEADTTEPFPAGTTPPPTDPGSIANPYPTPP